MDRSRNQGCETVEQRRGRGRNLHETVIGEEFDVFQLISAVQQRKSMQLRSKRMIKILPIAGEKLLRRCDVPISDHGDVTDKEKQRAVPFSSRSTIIKHLRENLPVAKHGKENG